MGFLSFKDLREQVVDAGQEGIGLFRKTSSNATTAGIWCDLSMASGHPVTNFYASTPLRAEVLAGNEGIQNGPTVSPKQKYLSRITAMGSVAPVNLMLCDYLLYYPFIDGDTTGDQALINYPSTGAQQISRYTDGVGVQAFLVAQGAYIGGAQFNITYTNQSGVTGRISTDCTSNTATTVATLISAGTGAAQFGPFIPLQYGDTGIRSVESVNFLTANGGIFALVLCRPLAILSIREANIPAEKDYLLDTGFSLPEIKDGAYLNFLALPNATIAAAPFYGNIKTIWG